MRRLFPDNQVARQADLLGFSSPTIYIIVPCHAVIKLSHEGPTNTGTFRLTNTTERKLMWKKQISNCDAKQSDKQQKFEQKMTEYLRHKQIHETLDLLALFEKPDTAKLVREVVVALMGGIYASIPCAGALSAMRLAGTVARKTRRTRTSDYVVGFMQQRPSRLLDMCRKRGKVMAFDVLPPS